MNLPAVAMFLLSASPVPLPVDELPAELRELRVDSTYARRTVFQAICGAQVDLQNDWLDEDIPTERAGDVARALRRPDDARRVLSCQRELERALVNVPVVRSASFNVPTSSGEKVSFFELPFERLPETASYGKDGESIAGGLRGRCFSAFELPERPCSALSDAIVYWPERHVWLAGRVVGLELVVSAARAPAPHPSGAMVKKLLDAANGLDVNALAWGGRELPWVAGDDAQGARVTRHLADTEADAAAFEAQLRAELETSRKNEASRVAWSCPECAPLLRPASLKFRELDLAHLRRQLAVREISRDGLVVTQRQPKVEDAALENARRALTQARQRRAAKIKPLLDAWLAGKPPSLSQLSAIDGAGFARAVKDRLH